MGWRYFVYIIGCITFFMFICRFFFFHLFESPKFLLSRGRQAEAVAVVHGIAYFNKSKTWLTEDILNQIGGDPEVVSEKLSTLEIIKRNLGKFSGDRIKPLFDGRKLAMTTVLLWVIWASIGMGYPLFNAFLPQYLGGGDTPVSIQYRNYAITSAVGVPGSFLACITVDMKYIGRKGTMGIATVISGILVCLFTTSKDSNTQLVYSSLEAFFQNIMYGVLYACELTLISYSWLHTNTLYRHARSIPRSCPRYRNWYLEFPQPSPRSVRAHCCWASWQRQPVFANLRR